MIALRAARLFDGVADRYMRYPVVLIDGSTIVAVHEGGWLPPGVPVVDLGDTTLLPGLVDAHVHLIMPGVPDPIAAVAVGDDQLIANARRAASACLDAGVTTVRDLGDRHYVTVGVRAEFSGQPSAVPHMLTSGPPITTSKGHCWFLGGTADGRDQLVAAVREHVRHGVDIIKVMASGGEITPGSHAWQLQYAEADLRIIVGEAHRLGLPVTAHAHAVDAIEKALAAGVDMIEHATFRTPTGVEPDQRLIAALATAQIPVSVTSGFAPDGPPLSPQATLRIDRTLAVAIEMRDAGVRIVCSSDAGISDQKPHGLLPHGVMRLVEAGFRPVEALRAATSAAADACFVGHRKGRLAPGFDADLLAVAGSPFDDIADILAVSAVYRDGQCVRSNGM